MLGWKENTGMLQIPIIAEYEAYTYSLMFTKRVEANNEVQE